MLKFFFNFVLRMVCDILLNVFLKFMKVIVIIKFVFIVFFYVLVSCISNSFVENFVWYVYCLFVIRLLVLYIWWIIVLLIIDLMILFGMFSNDIGL